MADTPIRELILQSIQARLQAITAGATYSHTVGQVVRQEIEPSGRSANITLSLTSPQDGPYEDAAVGGRKAGGNSGGITYRVATVRVVAHVREEAASDTKLIAIAADIERAVLADRVQGGYALNSWWTGSQHGVTEAATPHLMTIVEFRVQYRTQYANPGSQV